MSAPLPMQEAFWRRYNLNRTRRKPPAALGELVERACPDLGQQNDTTLRRIESAWKRVLPAEYADASRAEGFQAGRLRVVVDSASTRYVLERQLGGVLKDAVNAVLGSAQVSRIEFRIGRPEEAASVKTRRVKRSRGTKA